MMMGGEHPALTWYYGMLTAEADDCLVVGQTVNSLFSQLEISGTESEMLRNLAGSEYSLQLRHRVTGCLVAPLMV